METTEMQVVKFDITTQAIEAMRAEYMPLVISGLDDKKGYAACDAARKVVKKHRIAVENRRKELKEEALRFGQKVDGEAKRISSQLEEIEDHLRGQQDIIDKEAERQKLKAQADAKAKLDARILRLQGVRAQFDIYALNAMSDDDFAALMLRESDRYAAEVAEATRRDEEIKALREREAAANEEKRKAELEATRLREELIAKQKIELAEKAAEAEKIQAAHRLEIEKQAEKQRLLDEETRKAKEAEQLRVQKEAAEKASAEAAARKQVADKKLFDDIKAKFPTLESCWVEIARLMKGK